MIQQKFEKFNSAVRLSFLLLNEFAIKQHHQFVRARNSNCMVSSSTPTLGIELETIQFVSLGKILALIFQLAEMLLSGYKRKLATESLQQNLKVHPYLSAPVTSGVRIAPGISFSYLSCYCHIAQTRSH